MARKTNYDEKIAVLEAKIEKKKEELKKLKAQLLEIQAKKANEGHQELEDFMVKNNMSAAEVLAKIQG